MVAMNVWPTDAADGSVSSEARWRKMARLWAPSGVAFGVGSNMAPSYAANQVTVQAGAAWVDGHYCELASSQVLAVTANGLVVVRFDPAANTAQLLYRDAATSLQQDVAGIWEILIAQMTASAMSDRRTLVPANGQWVYSFVPTWTGGISNPSYGNSVIKCRYRIDGDAYCTINLSVTFGSSVSGGTGPLSFSLPFAGHPDHPEQLLACKTYCPAYTSDYYGPGTVGASDARVTPRFVKDTTGVSIQAWQGADATATAGTGIPKQPSQYTVQPGGNITVDGRYRI